ncbi:MAG: hypothetical protein M3139_18355 [Bacteroidota bacterium]|nr:hypothetical protein [Bacteroidota bacterium]
MKKLYLLIIAIIVVLSGAYLYLRFHTLKTKDYKPDESKAASVVDMRPAIIAKLQQLVKDGSDGLYRLSLDTLNVHLLSTSADISHASIMLDSSQLNTLDSAHKLPDDLFEISFSTLHIDGIGLSNFTSKDNFSLGKISITNPVIKIFHKEKWYNKGVRKMNDTLTLYQKITKKVKSISIDTIDVINGTVISHEGGEKSKANTFDNISININNLLIDSSTQYDTKRFLFAKQAFFSTKNYSGRTSDSLYFYKCQSINISAADHSMIAKGIELVPRYSRQKFESHLSARQAMFHITIPTITLSGIDWWDFTNRKSIIANEAVISNLSCKIYLDRSLPFRQVKVDNYPHQLLMRMSRPVLVKKLRITHANLVYNEYNPGLDTTATIYIDDMNGEVANITNMKNRVKTNRYLKVKSSGLFMHSVPMKVDFSFDLLKYKNGNFTTDLNVGAIDKDILNPVARTSGEFFLKKGSIQKGVVHVDGDNFKGNGHGQVLYKNLYLVGLKKDKDKPGGVKKKSVLSFIGNVLLIKNNNPPKGEEPKMIDFTFERKSTSTFLNVVWGTIFTGILKTIGLPPSFGKKKY